MLQDWEVHRFTKTDKITSFVVWTPATFTRCTEPTGSWSPFLRTSLHTANILTELPLYMTDVDVLLLFKKIVTLALKKDKLQASDYRRARLKVSVALANKNLLQEYEKDLLLLCFEIKFIYHENEKKRSPRSVLRLIYNISFRHGQAIPRLLTLPK